jgi:cysteine-rich repeat protein
MKTQLKFAVITAIFATAGLTGAAIAAPAPDANSVLILDTTVSGGAGSLEATKAGARGFTVVVADAATWAATTGPEFGTYRAIILGDATCGGSAAAAEANTAVWGPEIDGNVIVVGTDPTYHQSQGGAEVTDLGIGFATDIADKTGAYITLSCYYHGTAALTPVPLLDPFGSFSVTGVGCYNDAHIVATHPALGALTDADVSNWSCSVHEAFDSFDASFLPLVIANGIVGAGAIDFPDGSSGVPYIIARGETLSPILCGNGLLEDPEQCDDGNTDNGDGCSAQCTIEDAVGTAGRMNGGGGMVDEGGAKVTHGFELQCNADETSSNLQVNWGGNKFHLESLDSVLCSDNEGYSEGQPVAGLDTLVGAGTGRLNGESGASVEFTFTDQGEPGKNGDTASILIKDSGGSTVLSIDGSLVKGNHQALSSN